VEQFSGWKEEIRAGIRENDIIKSIPPGSIYLGGHGCDINHRHIRVSNPEAKPFFTILQNALTDGPYLIT